MLSHDGNGSLELSFQLPENRGISSTYVKCRHDRIATAAFAVARTGTDGEICYISETGA